MNYISYNFKLKPKSLSFQTGSEILIAQLGKAGFESFTEYEEGVIAYIQKKDLQKNMLDEVQLLQSEEIEINYETEEIEQVNWNSEWEKNFEPIQVNDLVSIRAPFHKNPLPMDIGIKYDIVIEPKMSFGTGHHETTHLMIEHLIGLDLNDKTVLDMGCGTGILAIFAEMKGASKLDAIDIDPWCYENSLENIQRNKSKHITVFQGDASLLNKKKYDIIIANINRNILLQDLSTYSKCLNEKGVLLLSGFYSEDIPIIDKEAVRNKLKLTKKLERNNWIGLKYVI
jgi:ribosomal protein L11 methyltransferase